jgi:hypothetical protein
VDLGGICVIIENMEAIDILQGISPIAPKEKTPMLMLTGFAYSTASGIRFDKENPFQLVPPGEVLTLLHTGRFRIATAEEIRSFYKI